MMVAAGLLLPPAGRAKRTRATEERRKEVAEALLLEHVRAAAAGTGAPAELEAARPIGRRPELLTGLPVAAQLIVGGTLLRVLQDLVGFLHFLELLLGILLLADVRMVFAGKTAVGLLDVLGRGRA